MFRKTTIALCSALLIATTATGAFAHGGGGGGGWGGGGRGSASAIHTARFEHGFDHRYDNDRRRWRYGYGGDWCYFHPVECESE